VGGRNEHHIDGARGAPYCQSRSAGSRPLRLPAAENGCGVPPPKVKVPPARAPVPVLLTVSVCAALVVPNGTVPNASEVGFTLAVSVPPPPPAAKLDRCPASTAPVIARGACRSQGSAPAHTCWPSTGCSVATMEPAAGT